MQQPNQSKSFFREAGLTSGVELAISEITAMYKSDQIPWVVGYSGGKDSTAVLQLVWMALARMPAEELHKPIYVITTDTLVENPIVSAWVNKSLERLQLKADEEGLPIHRELLYPDIRDTYWVNLVGRGYPAPRPKFRWCTMRLKIKPVNEFINAVIKQRGEAIVVLGARKAESAARAHVMNRLEKDALRERLRQHTMMPNSFVYSPIDSWTNDDVWMFLMQFKNPWGHNNKDLLTMYQGASQDGECPLVVDTTTPSCGDSRFGCWVCTLVDKDKSMTAMIQNDHEKEWMLPLLKLRDELIPRDENGFPADRHLRDFRRMHGNVQLMGEKTIPGPYLQSVREEWLRRVLEAQCYIRQEAPEDLKDIQLIRMEELKEIRRIWVNEKHEIEDSLPAIYEEIMGERFPDETFSEDLPLGRQEIDLLREVCGDDDLHFQLTRELLSVERQHRHMARRAGLFDELEKSFGRHFYDDETDATDHAMRLRDQTAKELAQLEPEPHIREIVKDEEIPGLLPDTGAES